MVVVQEYGAVKEEPHGIDPQLEVAKSRDI